MDDTTAGAIYGDVVLHYIAAQHEWCATFPPDALYGFGDTQERALRNLRVALRIRRRELLAGISALEGELCPAVDLDIYRRHKLAHAIQTAQPDCQENPP